MKAILYELEALRHREPRDYIYQYIRNRRLTEIYHSHDFYELIFLLQGKARQLVNECEWELVRGSLTILRPGDRHCFLSQSEDVVLVSLSVGREEFMRFADAFEEGLGDRLSALDTPPILVGCDEPAYLYTLPCEEARATDCKLMLSHFLKLHLDRIEKKSELPRSLAYAAREIKKRENLRRGVDALLELSSYSHSHLSRIIKKYFGLSPQEYITELRLAEGYSDILLTGKSIEDISEDLGYSSLSHFTKIFKKKYGTTPAALRRTNGVWTS